MRSRDFTKDFCGVCPGMGQTRLKSEPNAASAIILRTSVQIPLGYLRSGAFQCGIDPCRCGHHTKIKVIQHGFERTFFELPNFFESGFNFPARTIIFYNLSVVMQHPINPDNSHLAFHRFQHNGLYTPVLPFFCRTEKPRLKFFFQRHNHPRNLN